MRTRSSMTKGSVPPPTSSSSTTIESSPPSCVSSYVNQYRKNSTGLLMHFLAVVTGFLYIFYTSTVPPFSRSFFSSPSLSSLFSLLGGQTPLSESPLVNAFFQFGFLGTIIMLPTMFFDLFAFAYGGALMFGVLGIRGLLALPSMASSSPAIDILGVQGGWMDMSNWFVPSSVAAANLTDWQQHSPIDNLWTFVSSAGGTKKGNNWLFYVCLIHSMLYILYCVRMVFFMIYRDVRVGSYRAHRKAELEEVVINNESHNTTTTVPRLVPVMQRLFALLGMAFFVAMFYLPLYYLLENLNLHQSGNYRYRGGADSGGKPSGYCIKCVMVLQLVGYVTALKGILIELIADLWKQKIKEQSFYGRTRAATKDMAVMTGLYKYAQHPNYFGELLFYIGMFTGSIGGFAWEWTRWALGGLYPFGIMVNVMLNASTVLAEKQYFKYGKDKKYTEYARKTNTLFISPLAFWADILGFKQTDKKNKLKNR